MANEVRLFGVATLLVLAAFLNGKNVEAACGYEGCHVTKSDMINVHLVPHTHDDVGWLKTVDQYYYGGQNSIQRAGVQYILDSVVQELLKNSDRRFIYVESAFFFKWYNEQTSETQKDVKMLVENGRLEFAGGAWSMNDEAAVLYHSVIDQFTLGLKGLSETFGTCGRPRVGWQIDPFGHSREMASMFAQMGYDGEFFARMDWVEKTTRFNNKTAEMIWEASADLGESAEIFTGLLYNHYSAPSGFCFDTLCSDAPIIDGESYENNVEDRVNAFIKYVEEVSSRFNSESHLLVPMGDDFNYQNAVMNFKNMDKLIKYVNSRQEEGSKVNVFYSTPACYLKALHELSITWPVKTQDFFPYSTDYHTYWTGYYTSRPTQKRFERDGNHFLQVTKQLTTLANLTGTDDERNLDRLRQVMGIMQHHDAITGTEKQRVAYDYNRLLYDALENATQNTRSALQKLSIFEEGDFATCLLLNISSCEYATENIDELVVTLYNPLAHPSTQYVRIPVVEGNYEVTDLSGRVIPSDLLPVPKEVLDLEFRAEGSTHELVFSASVEKLSHFYVKTKLTKDDLNEPELGNIHIPPRFLYAHKKSYYEYKIIRDRKVRNLKPRAETIVKSSNIKLTFDSSGHLSNVEMNGVSEKIRQDFYYYEGAAGNNEEFKNRSSGAYIFRPNNTEILIGETVALEVHSGTHVKEVHQRFNEWVSQVIRLYEGVNRVEFEWLVGPLPDEGEIGKEVITRFTSDLTTKGVFWTDSNGREMLRRERNQREYYQANLTEAISGNYYPITARIATQDSTSRFALLNDRAQGGSSEQDGSLELMLHRRLFKDDAFGVGEALNEVDYGKGLIARGKVYLILSKANSNGPIFERYAQQEILLPFWKFFSKASQATNKTTPTLPDFSILPTNVHLLTLEPYTAKERLIRFENFLDGKEGETATFNIRDIFDALSGKEIRETTLDGNMPLSEMKRFKFQKEGSNSTKVEYYTSKHTPLSATRKDGASKFDVVLEPMQIRTFIIKKL